MAAFCSTSVDYIIGYIPPNDKRVMRTLEDEMISLVHEAFSNYWTRYNQAIREWEPILESNTERLNAQQSLAIHSESNSSDEHKTDSPSGILFADYLTVWLEDRRCKLEETTYGGYQQDIVQISPYFRERTLYIEQITDKVITNFYRYKRKMVFLKIPCCIIRQL